jgi:hypothetical protein
VRDLGHRAIPEIQNLEGEKAVKAPSAALIDWTFRIAWLAMVIVAVRIGLLAAPDNWSNQMSIRMNLGFQGQLTTPVMACQLAKDSAEFAQVFGRPLEDDGVSFKPLATEGPEKSIKPAAESDACLMKRILWRDYGFILCYLPLTLAFAWHLRLREIPLAAQKAALSPQLAVLVCGAIVVTAVCDFFENRNTIFSLARMLENGPLNAAVVTWARLASLAKWWAFACAMLVLAWGTLRLGGLLASVMGLFLLAGGGLLVAGLLFTASHADWISLGFQCASLGSLFAIGLVLPRRAKGGTSSVGLRTGASGKGGGPGSGHELSGAGDA